MRYVVEEARSASMLHRDLPRDLRVEDINLNFPSSHEKRPCRLDRPCVLKSIVRAMALASHGGVSAGEMVEGKSSSSGRPVFGSHDDS